jgi:hypothetical protein
MNLETMDKGGRQRAVWLGTILLLLVTVLSVLPFRGATPEAGVFSALVLAAGVLGMAWLTAGIARYPRWAWFTTAAVMAAGLVGDAVLASALGGPVKREEVGWLFPWLFLMLALSPPAKKGWCAEGQLRLGWLLVGTGVLLSVILLGARLIAHRI